MKINYDRKADAMYIHLGKAKYFESDEVSPGIIVDYDKSKKVIGIEVLNASKTFLRDALKAFKLKAEASKA